MHKESNHIHTALTEHPVHLAEETEYIISIKYINKRMNISIWLVGFTATFRVEFQSKLGNAHPLQFLKWF